MATPTSGQAAARQNGTTKTGGKRKVASAAGAARYHKPIGSEIGGPRDANHAAIQQDQGARKNYGDLINGDPAAQRKSLDGMSPEDLNKLADIAFSFKSTDPKVVALRVAARNAQARRGVHVPAGQTQTKSSGVRTAAKVAVGSKAAAKKSAAKKPAAKAAPAPPARNMRGSVKAMSSVGPASQRLIELTAGAAHTSKLGNFPIPDVNHLRKAVNAIGRAKPEHRPIIARHIIARAQALKAGHLISDHIRHYARGHRQPGTVGMSRAEQDAIELAGRWKHGYIPLDAEAMASKMKGGKGKPWWTGPGHSSGGASKALHGSPKSGSPGGSGKLTKVVKSEVPKIAPRGAKVNANPKLDHGRTDILRINAEHDAAVAKAKREGTTPPKFPYDKVQELKKQKPTEYKTPGEVHAAVLAGQITPQQGNTLLDELGRASAPKSRTIPDKPVEKPVGARMTTKQDVTDYQKQRAEILRKAAIARGETPAVKDPKRSTSDKAMTNPSTLAKNYVQMHGSEAARRKADQLENKTNPSSRDRALAGALKAWAGGGPGKA